ncbi:ring finger domain containing protein [Nitzschia inconspicua]|uniref:Ring finger domain containing protein n=1 Tax=Nitzschia inconspicua TaxID=303405 RepID=A0A9K3PYK0_9STRA|nr:ring finger domain containing protein [Nitzschia inconspicua]
MTKNGSFFVILSILFQSSMCFIVDSSGMVTFFDLTDVGFSGPRTAYTRKAQIVYAYGDSNSMRLLPYHRLVVNLMLPPEEYADLCTFPTQLLPSETDATDNNSSESTTSNTTSSSGDSRLESLLEDASLPIGLEFSPVAFLVPLQRNRIDSNSTDTGDCDVFTKIKVALQYQQHVFRDQQLWSVIFHSTHSDDNQGADEQDNLVYSMGIPDELNSTDIPGLDSLILAFISHTTARSIEDEMQRSIGVQYSKQMQESLMVGQSGYFAPYHLFNQGNLDWIYLVNVELGANVPSPGEGSQNNKENGGHDLGDHDFMQFHFVIFTIVFCFPFMLGVRLWWAAGGRIRVSRNERGWIIGLTHQSPTNNLNTTTIPNGVNLAYRTSVPAKIKLTKEQVLALPVLKYEGSSWSLENFDEHQNDDVVTSNLEPEYAVRDGAKIESTPHGTTQKELRGRRCSKVKKDGCFVIPLNTVCSICIDDFQHGELVRLMPRCGHGFHTSCILPWLTERQSYCPFCKTPAIGTTETEKEEVNEEGSTDENNPRQEV